MKKKTRGLLVPWLIFSVLNILASQVLSFNEHMPLLEELGWNFAQIRGKGDGVWFVAALFVVYIPFFFLIKFFENRNTGKKSRIYLLIFTLVLWILDTLYIRFMPMDILPWGNVCYPWHIEFIGWAMFPMTLGYLFRTAYEPKFDAVFFGEEKKIPIHPIVATLIGLVIYKLITVVPYMLGVTIEQRTALIPWNLLCILLGLIILILGSKCISKPGKYILFIGQNTLLCFALHGKAYSVIETCLHKFAAAPYYAILVNEYLSSILAILLSVAISVILIIPIYIINRWLPFSLGRTPNRRDWL